MPKILIDTDAYVDFLRTGKFDEIIRALYTFRTPDIHFSVVVAEELLQGADDSAGRRQVETLYKPFQKAARLIYPSIRDWLETGNTLSKIREKRPGQKTRLSHLAHDALIATTARYNGAVVYTSNSRDFELIAEFQSFEFQIIRRRGV